MTFTGSGKWTRKELWHELTLYEDDDHDDNNDDDDDDDDYSDDDEDDDDDFHDDSDEKRMRLPVNTNIPPLTLLTSLC